jgi:hypothetical protein
MEIPNAHETDSRTLLDLCRLEAQTKWRNLRVKHYMHRHSACEQRK